MGAETGETEDLLAVAVRWLEEGREVALATVVGSWGSSPRPPGSMLVIDGAGAFAGSVSGGCVEGAVIAEARQVIAAAAPRLLEFGVSDEQAWAVGLACGGSMTVFVEPAPPPALLRRLREERPLALVSHLGTGAHAVVREDSVDGGLALAGDTVDAARAALHADRVTTFEGVFVRVFNPPLRMVIVGAVHVAQSLAPMAALAGFQITVVDPRRAFATPERFPGVALTHAWPDEALEALAPDARTAVVTLVHDPKLDDAALEAALRSPAFYIGALGSRRAHADRLQRLEGRGFAAHDLQRLHGPVGLDIGGRSAPEIAVSIVAQAVAARYGKSR